MRPANVTDKQVINAGHVLLEKGRAVTGFGLRQEIKSGNPARLMKVWQDHLNSKEGTQPAADKLALPLELSEELTAFTTTMTEQLSAMISDLHGRSVRLAERNAQEQTAQIREELSQLNAELTDAAHTLDEADAKQESTQTELDALKKQLIASQATEYSLSLELAQMQERCLAAEKTAHAAQEAQQLALSQYEADTKNAQAETERVRLELSGKIEQQGEELAQLRERLAAREQSANDAVLVHQQAMTRLEEQLAAQQAVAKERGEHVASLQLEVSNAQREHAALSKSAEEDKARMAGELTRALEALATAQTRTDEATTGAQKASVDAARIAGQLQAAEKQHAELLELMAGRLSAGDKPQA